ncbi:MAG TPA: F420H(2):quinone oxidoreductase [Rikenellaceae bacterium]|nr:F420H(2):quinone oxidoreductase [Rikenellaceae bacterium]
MIRVTNKADCCGCGACASVCPRRCISMSEDREGFLYPHADPKTCVNCGLCEKVCGVLHPYPERKPLQVLAAVNTDEKIRLESSSGGVFLLLAEKIINEGGVVFGARFDQDWQVVIDYAETMEGVKAFMGSKYVQARVGNSYRNASKFLDEGRKVIFTGTPCEISGLHHFLGKPYDNLLSVDLICHGTPSPKVWRMYLDEVLDKDRTVKAISFRNKSEGWKTYQVSVEYDDAEAPALNGNSWSNHYMKAFLSDLILRPSCHSCAAKCGRGKSDITLADFWGIWDEIPDFYDDKGTSMVFVNTSKGKEFMNFGKSMDYRTADYDAALRYNPAHFVSVRTNHRREWFFTRLQNTDNVTRLIDKAIAPSLFDSCVKFATKVAKRVLKTK